jgi:hypothetical protein
VNFEIFNKNNIRMKISKNWRKIKNKIKSFSIHSPSLMLLHVSFTFLFYLLLLRLDTGGWYCVGLRLACKCFWVFLFYPTSITKNIFLHVSFTFLFYLLLFRFDIGGWYCVSLRLACKKPIGKSQFLM